MRIKIFLILIFTAIVCYSKPNRIDSLKNVLKTFSNDDTNKVNTLNSLS